jgi:hypothetical protein
MSGGSYNYEFERIEELAKEIRAINPLRKAFKTHLTKVAKACRDIEWVDSSDSSVGDEDAAIRDCLGKDTNTLILKELLAEAKSIYGDLGKAIADAQDIHAKQ